MDVAEMVDQLIEKKLTDFVDAAMENRGWQEDSLQNAIGRVVAEMMEKKIKARKEEIMAKAETYLDGCQIEIEFGGYGGLQVKVISPKKKKDEEK